MSNLTILGDTSGSVVLQAPAVAGSSTITLPTTGGTIRTTTTPGTILQVVSATYATEISNSTGTYSDAGLSASITPSSSSSKILILCSQGMFKSTASAGIYMQVLRDSTSILINGRLGITDAAGVGGFVLWSCNYLDSPATTSSITYKTQFKNYNSTGSAYVNIDGSTAQIILMEVAA